MLNSFHTFAVMEGETSVIVRRAAFDIGSGSTKLQCSDCEVITNATTGKVVRTIILKTLYGIERPVQFGADLKCASNGMLSESVQELGLSIFKELKAEADKLGAVEFHAIATEVFRKAANGSAYLDRIRELGVPVSILTQVMEAELGYGSVQAELSVNARLPAECVWDSGGASFQVTRAVPLKDSSSLSIESYMGALGSSVSTALLVKDIQKKELLLGSTPNPVSAEDSHAHLQLITSYLGAVPAWLQGMERTASCAGTNSMFTLCCNVLSILSAAGGKPQQLNTFSLSQAEFALRACLDKTDDELLVYASYPNSDGPHLIVPKLSLLVAVMRHADIRHVETVKCVGSCAGLLCDPRHWSA